MNIQMDKYTTRSTSMATGKTLHCISLRFAGIANSNAQV